MINQLRTAVTGALIALAVAACGSSSGSDGSQVTTVTTGPAPVEAAAFASPEVLIESLITAIGDGDATTLEDTLPADNWDAFGEILLGDFEAQAGDPLCAVVTDTSATCFIFDGGGGRVFEVTAEPEAGGWGVTRGVIDSTN